MGNVSQIHIRPTSKDDRIYIQNEMIKWWGNEMVVVRGEKYFPADYGGFVAEHEDEKAGLILLRFTDTLCEIMSLTTSSAVASAGKLLVTAAIERATEEGVQKMIAVTTNDNINALRFYQQMGFTVGAWRKGAVDRSRKIKPSIPLAGNYNIPIRDEIELELDL